MSEVRDAIAEAVRAVIQEHEGGFTIRWLALVESIGPDGDRGIWTLGDEDMKPWDAFGMLEFAKQLEINRMASGNDD